MSIKVDPVLGDAVALEVDVDEDVSTATTLAVDLKSPTGVSKSLTGTLSGTNVVVGQCDALTLDEVGDWEIRAAVTLPVTGTIRTRWGSFNVAAST